MTGIFVSLYPDWRRRYSEMTGVSFFVFCLGVLLGSGAFFRKGGEMLATYVLFPIFLATFIVGMKATDTEAYFSVINRAAMFGALLGGMGLLTYHIILIRMRGGLSLAAIGPDIRMGASAFWATLNGRVRHAAKAGARVRNASTIYYQTAVKLAALTTLIDKTPGADGFASVKATFNLNRSTCPEALNIFNAQMRTPERLRSVLKPFINQYGRDSTIAETLIYGMCKVALADTSASLAEIRLIDRAADILGLDPFDTRRVIASAGIEIENEFAAGGSGGTRWQDERWKQSRQGAGQGQTRYGASPQSERSTHLATLGLPPSASMSQAKSAWRKLAVKYHPDKLVSQNLPPDEMAKAEAMMQAINEAYDWLKDNSK